MDQFVDSQREVGQGDSSGSFTLSPELAREKLKEYQLAHPCAYLLKVVQAGVKSGASGINVKVTRSLFSVTLEDAPKELQDPQALLEAVPNSHNLPDSGLRHLAVGLNAASFAQLTEVRWESPLGTLQITNEAMTVLPNRSPETRLVIRKKRTLSQWFFGSLYLAEERLLEEKCRFCPLLFILDGRVLKQPFPDRYDFISRDELGLEKKFYLYEGYIRKSKGLPLTQRLQNYQRPDQVESQPWIWSQDEKVLKRRKAPARPLLLEAQDDTSELEVEAVFAISPQLDGLSYLKPIKDGVLLESVLLPDFGHGGTVLIAQMDDWRADLSEFRLVQNSEFHLKMSEYSQKVCESLESVPLAFIEMALWETSMEASLSGIQAPRIFHWFQNHCEAEPDSLEGLLRQCFSPEEMEFSGWISAEKLERVRTTHGAHLPPEEEILGLVDDSLLKNGKLGFVITSKRICWKNTLSSSNYILWEELRTRDLQSSQHKVELMGTDIGFNTTKSAARLKRFLRSVHRLKLPEQTGLTAEQKGIRDQALETLGKRGGIHYFPHLPIGKVDRFRDSTSLEVKEQPLVYYDDTFFGGGDNGFVITAKRIVWKNIMAEPLSLELSEIAELEIQIGSLGVKLGKLEISCSSSEVKSALLEFLKSIGKLKLVRRETS